MGERGLVDLAGEHPGQLPATLLALHPSDACKRAPVGGSLGDDYVCSCLRGYLRQGRDSQALVAFAELPELRPDRRGRLAANTCVYLVEDVRRPRLDALLGEPDG